MMCGPSSKSDDMNVVGTKWVEIKWMKMEI